jgi:hypothetical protein
VIQRKGSRGFGKGKGPRLIPRAEGVLAGEACDVAGDNQVIGRKDTG